ncbi:NAD(P)-dependent oxidoreductase [Saliphagus sp. GCM10025308]
MTDTSIGVVGLGLMGGNIATHFLDAGWDVHGFDVSDERVADLETDGLVPAETAAALADEVDVVITSLPTPDVVDTVYLGDDGIAAGAGDGVTAIDMSTIDPNTTRTVAESAPAIDLIDAPVSGGPENCLDGTLVILCGGNRDVYDREYVQEILDSLGRNVYYAGETGAGHTVKLLNNVISMGNLLLSLEVTSMGVAAGVEPEVLNEILPNTGGASNQFRKRFPRVLNRNFEPGFTVDYAKKDIGLAMDTAENEEVPMVLSSLIYQLFTKASAEGHGGEDACSVVKLFEQSTGVPVEADTEVDETFEGYR